MPLLNELLNAGVNTGDAQVLAQEYPNEPDFLAGLEQIAKAMVIRNPGINPPQAQPWGLIYAEMINGNNTLENALSLALSTLPPIIQVAVSGAINTRKLDIQTWWNNIQNNRSRKTADYMRLLGMLGYDFKFNQCRQEIECNGAPMTDELMKKIRGQIRDAGIWETHVAEDAYAGYAYDHRYHPIKDYITSLQWDGKPYIEELSAHFVDEYHVFGMYLRKWLIGAIARVMAREQNRMLVMDGRQGMGKDHFAKWLASSMPTDYFFEGPILPEDKDCRIRLMRTWIWDAGELGHTTGKQDREALKAFLTLEWVQVRKPYGHFDVQGPALSSFIGTANNERGLLNDPTGSRRFMITHLTDIDWNYTKIDVSNVWAEAYAAYLAGETGRLAGADADRASEINETYQMVDMVEEAIKGLFEIDLNQSGWTLSSREIMETLKDPTKGNLKVGSELDGRRLASALTHLGLDRPIPVRTNGILLRGYKGIRRRGP